MSIKEIPGFFKAMKYYEYYNFCGDRFVSTLKVKDKIRLVHLKDIEDFGEGKIFDRGPNFKRHSITRFKKSLLDCIEAVEFCGYSPDFVAEKMPNSYFTDFRYWEMLKVAVWMDTVNSIIREQLGGKYVFHNLPEKHSKTQWMAFIIGAMSFAVDFTEQPSMENSYTFKMFPQLLPQAPAGDWDELEKAKAAIISALWKKCREILLEEFNYGEAVYLIKNYGEAIK